MWSKAPIPSIFVMHALGVGGVNEGFMTYHVTAHIHRPFQVLRSDVDQEGLGGPAAEEHDPCGGDVLEEESHGGTGLDGLVSDVGWVKSEGCFATKVLAGGS